MWLGLRLIPSQEMLTLVIQTEINSKKNIPDIEEAKDIKY